MSVSNPRRNGLLLLGAVSMVACATVASRVTLTLDEDVIRFPHAKHQENEVECKTCHKGIAQSTGFAKVRQLPKEEICLKCHSDWKDENKCSTCHQTQPPRSYPARPHCTENFNHAFHLKQVDNACERCHKELPEPGSTKRYTPKMSICLECHQSDYNDGVCTPCHTDFRRLPLRPLAYFSHEGEFLKRHASLARVEPNTCARCHEQTFCSDCHARTAAAAVEFKYPELAERQFLHRNDYVTRHAIEAREDPALCRRCHGVSFCEDCHSRSRATSWTKTAGAPLHPAGWMTQGSASFHGAEARRDISSCQNCHERGAQTNCIGCHRVGGVGGNPHPPSFMTKHKVDEVKTNAMCQYCHP